MTNGGGTALLGALLAVGIARAFRLRMGAPAYVTLAILGAAIGALA